MDIKILASGSQGNLVLIETCKSKLLIDFGLSYSKIIKKLNEENLSFTDIDMIIITHEHGDHSKGIQTALLKNHTTNFIMTTGTFKGLLQKSFITKPDLLKNMTKFLIPYKKYQLNDIEFMPILNSHDAFEPIGIIIYYKDKKIVNITDTGYVSEKNKKLIENADLYILESNHDLSMLNNSSRPNSVKLRIISDKGHLSNNQATSILNAVIDKTKKTIWAIAHISSECNNKELIEREIIKNVSDISNLDIKYTSQFETVKIKL